MEKNMHEQIQTEAHPWEHQLLREITYWRYNRSRVARTYQKAAESGVDVDWEAVHSAIVQRWSYFAVEWIRREAKRLARAPRAAA